MSDSLWPHGLQHARLPCHSSTLGACSNSCPSSRWCHPTISSPTIPFSSWLQSFPESGSFSNESVLCIRWPKYWSFSISPSNAYSGLISFRIDWFGLLAVQRTLKSVLQAQLCLESYSHIHTWLLENQPWIFIGRTDAKAPILWPSDAKSQFIGKRPWFWERLKAGGEGDGRGWDSGMASPTRWTWVWASSKGWWWTGKPGML